jgi:hypothetical protein
MLSRPTKTDKTKIKPAHSTSTSPGSNQTPVPPPIPKSHNNHQQKRRLSNRRSQQHKQPPHEPSPISYQDLDNFVSNLSPVKSALYEPNIDGPEVPQQPQKTKEAVQQELDATQFTLFGARAAAAEINLKNQHNFRTSHGANSKLGYSDVMGAERLKQQNKLHFDQSDNIVLDPQFQRFMPDIDNSAPDVVRLSAKGDFNLDFDLELQWQKVNDAAQLKDSSYLYKHQEAEYNTVFHKMVGAKQREFAHERVHLEAIKNKKELQKLEKIRLVRLTAFNMAKTQEEIDLEEQMADFLTSNDNLDPMERYKMEESFTKQSEHLEDLKYERLLAFAKAQGVTEQDLEMYDHYYGDELDGLGPSDELPQLTTQNVDFSKSPQLGPRLSTKQQHSNLDDIDTNNFKPGFNPTALFDKFQDNNDELDEADILEHYYGYDDILKELYDADVLTPSSNSILHKLEHAMDPEFDTKAEALVKDIAIEQKVSVAEIEPKSVVQSIKLAKVNLANKNTQIITNELGEIQFQKVSPAVHDQLRQQRENISVGGHAPGAGLTKGIDKLKELEKDDSVIFDPEEILIPASPHQIHLSKAEFAELELNREKLTETGRNDRFDNFDDEPEFADMKRRLFRKHNQDLALKWDQEALDRGETSLYFQQERMLELKRLKEVNAGKERPTFKPLLKPFGQFQPVDKNEHLAQIDAFAEKTRKYAANAPITSVNGDVLDDSEDGGDHALYKGLKYGLNEDKVYSDVINSGHSTQPVDHVSYASLLGEDVDINPDNGNDNTRNQPYFKKLFQAEKEEQKIQTKHFDVLGGNMLDTPSSALKGRTTKGKDDVTFDKTHDQIFEKEMEANMKELNKINHKVNHKTQKVIGLGSDILGEGNLSDIDESLNNSFDKFKNLGDSPTLETLGFAKDEEQLLQTKYQLKSVKPRKKAKDDEMDEVDRDFEKIRLEAEARSKADTFKTQEEFDSAMKDFYTTPIADPNSSQGYQLGETSPIEHFDFYKTAPHLPEKMVDNVLDSGAGHDPLEFDSTGQNVLKNTKDLRKLQGDYEKLIKKRQSAADKRRVIEMTSNVDDGSDKFEKLRDELGEEDQKYFSAETGEVFTARPAKPSYDMARKYVGIDHVEDAHLMDAAGEDFLNGMFSKGRAKGGIGMGDPKQDEENEQAELGERLQDLNEKMKEAHIGSNTNLGAGIKMHPSDYLNKLMFRIHPDMFAAEKYRVVDDKITIDLKRNLKVHDKNEYRQQHNISSKHGIMNVSSGEYETGTYQNPHNVSYYEVTGDFLQQHNSKMLSDFNSLVEFYKKLADLSDGEKSDPFLPHLQDNSVPKAQSFVFFLRPTANDGGVKKPKNLRLMKSIWDENGEEMKFDRSGRLRKARSSKKSQRDKSGEDNDNDNDDDDDDDDVLNLMKQTLPEKDDAKESNPKQKKKKTPFEQELDPRGLTLDDFYIDGKDQGDNGNTSDNGDDDVQHIRSVRVWFTPPPKLPQGTDPREFHTAWMLTLERTMVEALSGLSDKDVPLNILERWKTELTATYVSKTWNTLVKKRETYLDKIFKTTVQDLVAPSEEQVIESYKNSNMAYYHMFPYATKQREADFRAKTHPRHHLFNALMVGGYISFDKTVEPKQRIKSLHDLNRLISTEYQNLDCFRWWNKTISQNDIYEQAKIEEYIQHGNDERKKKGKLDPYDEEMMNLFPYHDEERQNVWPSAENGEQLSMRFAIHYLPEGSKPVAQLVSSRKLILSMHGTQGQRANVLKEILSVGADVKAKRSKDLLREKQLARGNHYFDGDQDDNHGYEYVESKDDFELKSDFVFRTLQNKHQEEQKMLQKLQQLKIKKDNAKRQPGQSKDEPDEGGNNVDINPTEIKQKLKLMKLNQLETNNHGGDNDESVDEDTEEERGQYNLEKREKKERIKKHKSQIQNGYIKSIMTDLYGSKNREHLLNQILNQDDQSAQNDTNNDNFEQEEDFIFSHYTPELAASMSAQQQEREVTERLKNDERKYSPPTSMNDVCLQVRVPMGISPLDLQKHLMTHAYILYDEWKMKFTGYHLEFDNLAQKKNKVLEEYQQTGVVPKNEPLFKQHIFSISELWTFLHSDISFKERVITNPSDPTETKVVQYRDIVLNTLQKNQPDLFNLVSFYQNMTTMKYKRYDIDPNPEATERKEQEKMDHLRAVLKERTGRIDEDDVQIDTSKLDVKSIKPDGNIDTLQRNLAADTFSGLLGKHGKKLDKDDRDKLLKSKKVQEEDRPQEGAEFKITFTPAPQDESGEKPAQEVTTHSQPTNIDVSQLRAQIIDPGEVLRKQQQQEELLLQEEQNYLLYEKQTRGLGGRDIVLEAQRRKETRTQRLNDLIKTKHIIQTNQENIEQLHPLAVYPRSVSGQSQSPHFLLIRNRLLSQVSKLEQTRLEKISLFKADIARRQEMIDHGMDPNEAYRIPLEPDVVVTYSRPQLNRRGPPVIALRDIIPHKRDEVNDDDDGQDGNDIDLKLEQYDGIDPNDEVALEAAIEAEMESYNVFEMDLKSHPRIAPLSRNLKETREVRKQMSRDLIAFAAKNPDDMFDRDELEKVRDLEFEYLNMKAIEKTYEEQIIFTAKLLTKEHFPRVYSFLYREEIEATKREQKQQSYQGSQKNDHGHDNTRPELPDSLLDPLSPLTTPELLALEIVNQSKIPRHQRVGLTENLTIQERLKRNEHMYRPGGVSQYNEARQKFKPILTVEQRAMKLAERRGELTADNIAKANAILHRRRTDSSGKPLSLAAPPPTSDQPTKTPKTPKHPPIPEEFDFDEHFEVNVRAATEKFRAKQRQIAEKSLEKLRQKALKQELREAQEEFARVNEAETKLEVSRKAFDTAKTPHDRVELMISNHNAGLDMIPHKKHDDAQKTKLNLVEKMKKSVDDDKIQRVQSESLMATTASFALASSTRRLQEAQNELKLRAEAGDKNAAEQLAQLTRQNELATQALKDVEERNAARKVAPTRRERRASLQDAGLKEGLMAESVNSKLERQLLESKTKKETESILAAKKAIEFATGEIEKKKVARDNIRRAVLYGTGEDIGHGGYGGYGEFDPKQKKKKRKSTDITPTPRPSMKTFHQLPMDVQLAELNATVNSVVNSEAMLSVGKGGKGITNSNYAYFGNIFGATDNRANIGAEMLRYQEAAKRTEILNKNKEPEPKPDKSKGLQIPLL